MFIDSCPVYLKRVIAKKNSRNRSKKAFLAKGLSVRLQTKWLRVRVR